MASLRRLYLKRFEESDEVSHRDTWGCVLIKTTARSEAQVHKCAWCLYGRSRPLEYEKSEPKKENKAIRLE